MIIQDFICLGRTVPENSKKYGHKVCMAGFSPELNQLMRVYPLEVKSPIRARRVCELSVERNPGDSRRESWKLRDRDTSIISVSEARLTTPALTSRLDQVRTSTIDELNANRCSLGIVEPVGSIELYCRQRDSLCIGSKQQLLFNELKADIDLQFGADAIPLMPYLRFHERDGKQRTLQLREWGCYELLRKHGATGTELADAIGIGTKRFRLLVGNMATHRNVWMVIAMLRMKTERQALMFV